MKREEIMAGIAMDWDIIVIGGGITGAGIFNEATKQGLKTLLVEQNDFAWGTSSRSAKLIHGGLRYLGQGQIRTTWHCVHERERLLEEYKNLVEPLRFLFPAYKKDITPHLLNVGLKLYDLMAGRPDYQRHNSIDFKLQTPSIADDGLKGGLSFTDAKTDDARLVLRVIEQGIDNGGTAVNYAEVKELLKDSRGNVRGISLLDKISGTEYEIKSKSVINATGIFADNIRSKLNKRPLLRKLRGSHIIFPEWRFPVYQAISFNHPADNRPLYVLPWQGATLFGTTDVEHDRSIDEEPKISKQEADYLFSALDQFFPSLKLSKNDAVSTFSGIRPVLNTGKSNPSKESRDYLIINDNGLITVTGGKLTTFRLLALDALKEAKKSITSYQNDKNKSDKTNRNVNNDRFSNDKIYKQLEKIFGNKANDIYQDNGLIAKGYIENTETLWAELIWSLRNEQVVHLDDLLLRRSRIGLIAENGGINLLDDLEEDIINGLGYDKIKFNEEKNRYIKLWEEAYSPSLL